MNLAIQYAREAANDGDYAVGAVIAYDNVGDIMTIDDVVAASGNRAKRDEDPTAHAEMVVLREAAKKRGKRHLQDLVLYTTHEPCPMCTSAAIWAKLRGIVYGARMTDMEDYARIHTNVDYSWRLIKFRCSEIVKRGEPRLEVVEDFMRDECIRLFHNGKTNFKL